MAKVIPQETVDAFARTIHHEAQKYGFRQIDTVRLINALMDFSADSEDSAGSNSRVSVLDEQRAHCTVDGFPLTSQHLHIRAASQERDLSLLEGWMEDEYGKHFLLSCATAQQPEISALLANPKNDVGIVELLDGTPIGAVAYLDIDKAQRRAELRKLVGVKDARGKGYAEEATLLWIEYGLKQLGLEKIYVSTLQTHIRNIKLNESVGFRVEGVLRGEVCIDGQRCDVLRMGLCAHA